jgi:salicylate biosynthesis isochorismate synthase/menaquinone-specific isochorismate synthase
MRAATEELLEAASAATARAAERDRRTLASATVAIEPLDVSGTVLASRLASDRWFCWEQPDRDGFALGALGAASEVGSRGPDRFDHVAADCAELLRDAVIETEPGLPAGAGPVWTGGFAFDAHGGTDPQWASLPPALMVLP